MKKFFTLLFVLSANLVLMQAQIASGPCGAADDNLTWSLDKNSDEQLVLTISGEGDMSDYEDETKAPWSAYLPQIVIIQLNEGVTTIGNCAFFGTTSLQSITMPSTLTSIGEYSLQKSGIAELIIPNSVNNYGRYAFSYCPNLKHCELSNQADLTYSLFSNDPLLESVLIPEGVEIIQEGAFTNCPALAEIALPNSLTDIEDYAFMNCSALKEIVIPENLTFIGKDICTGCPLEKVVWNAKNCPVLVEAGSACPPFNANRNTITTFSFGNEVQVIPTYLCSSLARLLYVIIPEKVATIKDGAFWQCQGMVAIYNHAVSPQQITASVLEGISRSACKLYVPESSIPSYGAALVWKEFEVKVLPPNEGFEQIRANGNKAQKVLSDGQVFVTMPDGTLFNAGGQQVR